MLNYKALIEKQRRLAQRVVLEDRFSSPLRTIAGVDVTFLDHRCCPTIGLAAIVVFSYPKLAILESAVGKARVPIPYIPGLLAFRELAPILATHKKLTTKADIYLVDGQGIAHPRGVGIASHLGVELGIPTIGCAKSLLYGIFDTPPKNELALSPLLDKLGSQIGSVIRPRRGGRQLIFVSPGHLVSIETATNLVKKLFVHSLPEPIRVAHSLLVEERRRMLGQKALF